MVLVFRQEQEKLGLTGLQFGLDRNAKYRALEWLENANLITVERRATGIRRPRRYTQGSTLSVVEVSGEWLQP